MPSLFSRSRTTSTPKKSHTLPEHSHGLGSFDEFGRVNSKVSNYGSLATPSKKDKKKLKDSEKRSKTFSPDSELVLELPFPDGAFLPLTLDRPRLENSATELGKDHDYGHLAYERHVILSLEQVERLVEVLCEELETRGGATTPFIFSNTALDISATAIKRLIKTFLQTCEPRSGRDAQEAEIKWRDEARFAGPHELGMCLRWGLARVIRSVGGQDVRGLVSWDHYIDFRDSEAAQGYPPLHFATHFLPDLAPPLQAIIIRLLSLLTRIIANGTSSGHTPPSISPLFGPLFFGLGPATLAFHHAYIHYLRAVYAMEHIILAFIRWQDAPRLTVSSTTGAPIVSGSATSLGVPSRLKEWIKGYPAMLPALENNKPQPRKGARTVRVVNVRRNVRMYSPDLVKSASTWAHKTPGSTPLSNSLADSKEWERIAPSTLKLQPRYSDAYKRRMDLSPNYHPEIAPGSVAGVSTSSSTSSYFSTASSSATASPLFSDPDFFGGGSREGEDRFRSLTDLKWGEFESSGFGTLNDEKKLQFDLTETARQERTVKRQTLSWNDFSSSGFTRMDAPLSATLQFSTPLATTISQWPAHNAEISKKLKKANKSLPAFGWDTEPVIGSEEVIEEAFVDVFCDLIYGSGWMDLERTESVDRDCNWALVEYKCLPPARSTISGTHDPRTSSILILFEEFVPLEYRQQLALGTVRRSRLPSIFSPSSKKQWKQAPTLNGRPYVLGTVPTTPSYREVEFEGLLHANNSTKVISLHSKPTTRIQSFAPTERPVTPIVRKHSAAVLRSPEPEQQPQPPLPAKSDEMHSDSAQSASAPAKRSRFKLPTTPGSNRKSMIPAEYSTVEFETRMASYSDDEFNGEVNEPDAVKQKRRESRDDAWVDILVGSQGRRLGGQDADLGDRRRGGQLNRRSDPDLASKEVAQVLASVQNRSPSPPSLMEPVERVDRDYGMDQHVHDLDVDEVETVPRNSESRSGEATESEVHLAYEDSADPHDPEVPEAIRQARLLAQRRVGYFELHPERRKAVTSMADEDPRDKLAQDDSDEEGDDDRIYGTPEVRRPLPVPPVPQPIVPAAHPIPVAPLKTSTMTSQSPEPKPKPIVISEPKPTSTSKTAALIEMYRERERAVPPAPSSIPPVPIVVAPLQPSRLPVRTASLPKESPSPDVTLPATPSPKASPKVSPNPSLPEVVPLDLPRIPFEETGRHSPARYVHGAPLHNVIEEEEE